MRILLYGINFAPELTGIGKYTGEMAAALAARGHDVRVVTAPPYYPEWRIHRGFRRWWYQRDEVGPVQVYRCPVWVPKRPTGMRRVLHLASFAITSVPMLFRQLSWRPDVVWVVEPPIACTPGALLLARFGRALSWLHIQDFEIDAAFDLGILKSGRMRRGLLRLERALLRRFHRVSTISEAMRQRVIAKGIDTARAVLFPNWVDVEQIRPLGRPGEYREELGIDDRDTVILYAGSMGKKQGLDILARVARQLRREPGIHFLFCGTGPGRADLEAACSGLANVRFLDLQPLERLNELLGTADVHVLPQRADAEDLVLPSKLTGMLASGIPIVATARPGTEIARCVEHAGAVVEPEDAASMAAAIRDLARDDGRRRELGAAGRRFAVEALSLAPIIETFVVAVEEAIREEIPGKV